MKTRNLYVIALTALIFCACKPKVYYQVYKATPTESLVIEQNALVYEDENCEVTYNLWSNGGDVGFSFYNKTDKDIFLSMDESYFILNGVAHDYFRDRTFLSATTFGTTDSRGASASTSLTGFNFFNLLLTNRGEANRRLEVMNSSENSVTFKEQSVICIPPRTFKYITEYNITNTLYRDCDLFRYPKKSQVVTKRFYESESPIVFSNRLSYTVGDSNELIKFENKFYVSEITNYPEKEITADEYTEFCGERSKEKSNYFKDVSADKFYIRYVKGYDDWKH